MFNSVAAAEPGLAPGADLTERVRRFMASLEPDKQKAASFFAWNGADWRNWNHVIA